MKKDSCETCSNVDAAIPDYDIKAPIGKRGPRTVAGLSRILSRWGAMKGEGWKGKMYVARTISHSTCDEADGFAQKGCAPNFRGGLWTLTTCKYAMRRATPFKNLVKSKTMATVVLVFCKVSDRDNRQYLVSAAHITNSFATMRAYFRHLCDHHTKATRLEKCSSAKPVGPSLGYRFGDCHVDSRGSHCRPRQPHVHAGRRARADLAGDHRLLASTEYLVWDRPTIWAKSTMCQSAYGINVDEATLHDLLTDLA